MKEDLISPAIRAKTRLERIQAEHSEAKLYAEQVWEAVPPHWQARILEGEPEDVAREIDAWLASRGVRR